jgi:hypothetical protein
MDVEGAFIEQAVRWRCDDLGWPERGVAFKEPDVERTRPARHSGGEILCGSPSK